MLFLWTSRAGTQEQPPVIPFSSTRITITITLILTIVITPPSSPSAVSPPHHDHRPPIVAFTTTIVITTTTSSRRVVARHLAHRGRESHLCDWFVVGALVRMFVIGYCLCACARVSGFGDLGGPRDQSCFFGGPGAPWGGSKMDDESAPRSSTGAVRRRLGPRLLGPCGLPSARAAASRCAGRNTQTSDDVFFTTLAPQEVRHPWGRKKPLIG